jgi:hypothetical protein
MKVEPAPYTLAYYTDRAKHRSVAEMRYAVTDINATLTLHSDRSIHDPYVAKLLAEMDAYSTEMMLRARRSNGRKK